VIEAFLAIGFGIAVGSIALVGFGFDSVIEVFAASVVIWELRGIGGQGRERVALGLIAVSFVVMKEKGLVDALTTDHNSEQAGFVRLLAQ